MFDVAIHIAIKMAIKSNTSCKRPFPTFLNLNFRLVQHKSEKKRRKNCNILGSKTSENDLLTMNYGLSQ